MAVGIQQILQCFCFQFPTSPQQHCLVLLNWFNTGKYLLKNVSKAEKVTAKSKFLLSLNSSYLAWITKFHLPAKINRSKFSFDAFSTIETSLPLLITISLLYQCITVHIRILDRDYELLACRYEQSCLFKRVFSKQKPGNNIHQRWSLSLLLITAELLIIRAKNKN